MRIPSLDKVAFVLSLVFGAFLYGVAAETFGWFPSSLLQRAWNQAEATAPIQMARLRGQQPRLAFRHPQVYDRHGSRTVRPDRVQPGLTLIATIWKDFGDRAGLKLIDEDGRVIHGWKVDPEKIFSSSDVKYGAVPFRYRHLHGTHLFPDGDVMVNVEHTGLVRLDACGGVRWKLPVGTDHSIAQAEDGSFWIPSVAPGLSDGTEESPKSFPGLGQPRNQNRVLRVQPDGKVVREINVLQVLYANALARHVMKYGPEPSSADITHLNDAEPLPASLADEYPLFEAGDLLLSVRNFDLVLVVDPDDERVKWHASEPFIQQHDSDFIGDGWIGVFDNNKDGTDRGTLLGGSRIVALQPHTGSERVLFPTDRSEPFYTSIMGKWQRLSNGNLLLTESLAGRVVEVTPGGETVWEWIAEPYEDSTVPWVQEGTRYDLTEEEVAAWPCSPL